VKTAGGYPTITYLWKSTSHDGRVASCRGGVVRMTIRVSITTRLSSGVAYSDDGLQMIWSMFDTAACVVPRSVLYVAYMQPFAVVNQPVSTFCLIDALLLRLAME